MSRRRNRTLRAAVSLGINLYGWGNGKARKRPREVRTLVGQYDKTSHPYYKGYIGGLQDAYQKRSYQLGI